MDLAGTGAAPGAPYLDFGARLYSPGTATWLSVDPMAEKHLQISPFVYCHCDPINRYDLDGNVDWKMVQKGALGLLAGIGSAITGAALTGAIGGAAIPIGSVMIFDGVTGIGFGATYTLIGLLSNPSAENDKLMESGPTNASNAIAKSGDLMAGNKHHEIEFITNIIELGLEGTFSSLSEYATLLKNFSELEKGLTRIGTTIQIHNDIKMLFDNYLLESGDLENREAEKKEQEEKKEWQGIKTFVNE